jgi:4'-phosphopantetheinyl transferase
LNIGHNVGLDLENITPRLKIVEYKFLTEHERTMCEGSLENLCMFWSAKEALYKFYGKRGVHFQKELLIHSKHTDHLLAEINTELYTKNLKVYFEKFNNSFLTLAME